MDVLHVRYARWNLSFVTLVDPYSNTCIDTLYPQDKSANANGLRRQLSLNENLHTNQSSEKIKESAGIAPLLKDLMAQYAATGLPPAYLPKSEEKKEEKK